MGKREIVGLIGSLTVSILVAAADLLVEGNVLLYSGIIGGALTIILWLWSWAFPPPKPEADADKERRSRRRKILNDARAMVAKHELQDRWDWRQTARYSEAFTAVRPHLGERYLNRMNDMSTIRLSAGMYESLVAEFLTELDRLEREWGLS